MKHRKLLSLALALALLLALAAPAWAAGSGFPDVPADAWYAEGVRWAADAGVVRGYPDGSFGVGRACTWDEAIVMLWRAAGSKAVGDGLTETDRAWAWLERQCGANTAFTSGDVPISRLQFAALLYLALGDMADVPAALPFTDVELAPGGAYDLGLRWCVSKGVMQGYGQGLFCPDATLTREQVVTVLRRCFDGELRYTVTERSVPFYRGSPEEQTTVTVYSMDGVTEVPYLSLEGLAALLETVFRPEAADYAVSVSTDGDRAILWREDGYYMLLDFGRDTISFLDYDAFLRVDSAGSVMDFVEASASVRPVVQIVPGGSERYGRTLTLDLGAYGVRLVHQDGGYYVPLQTASDFLFAMMNMPLRFNGAALFLGAASEGSAQNETFYSVPTGQRSMALALFNWKELCLAMDHLYGLKAEHGIRSFAEEIKMIDGLYAAILGTDPAAADEALWRLTFGDLDDIHTGFLAPSHLEGPETAWEKPYGDSALLHLSHMERILAARTAAYPDGVPGYEEVGDVAFITLRIFDHDWKRDYYADPPTEPDPNDTYALMLYSFAQITRESSPVKHVVLDLSYNGGGASHDAALTIAMFLGEGSLSVQNALTGAQVTQKFRADMNLDGVFDERDELRGVDLFCMTSPISFSSGNLVPSALKSSGRVAILGQTSGGGTCAVLPLTAADGAAYQISGPYRVSFLKNGSFYNIDQGVTPDIYIHDFATFYDRAAVADIIHALK